MSEQNKTDPRSAELLRATNEMVGKLLGSSEEFNELTADDLATLREAYLGGEPLYRVLGMKESMVRARQTVAGQLYAAGNHKDAEAVFRWLCIYDNTEPENWIGLAASRQAQKNYEEAFEAYQMAAAYGALADPSPFYYSGVCLLKMNRIEDAKAAFQAVLALAEAGNATHEEVREQAKTMLAGLESQGV